MAEKTKERLRHTILALLLSVGLVMPLCGALDEALVSPHLLIVIAGVVLVFELAALHKVSSLCTFFAICIGATAWIFAGNGAKVLSDAGVAISLRVKGIRTAVPLVAQSVSLLIATGISLLCCLAVLRSATCIPSLALCAAVMFAVWLTNSTELIPWLLPALAAVLTLLMIYRHDSTPISRVLPWVTALVTLAFLIAGNVPKNNALKEKTDEIRQAVLDRLFFTEARDVFSLYSVGFSPQGADQLGGKPNPNENPVMQVSTPKTTYLRGTVYNRYTGHGWQNTTGGRRYLWQSRIMADIRASLFDEILPPDSVQNSLSEPQQVQIRMLTNSASTLFVPQRIRELNPGGETVPYFSNSSEIFITRDLEAGDTWEVFAPLYNSSDPGIGSLTEICSMLDDPQWNSVRNTYTELPAHLEKPVMDLANDITGTAKTPYEKAMAVQNYLTRNYKYSLDVGEHPENIDFVTSFLFDTKKGYCTYFASAMTVLCRIIGLPARYVEGYLAEPNEYGEALVTGLNAHAWTEIYFAGFGWLTFDATPGQHTSGKQGGHSDEKQTPTEESMPITTPKPKQENGNETPEPSTKEQEMESNEDSSDQSPNVPNDSPEKSQDKQSDSEDNPEKIPKNRPNSFPWWLLILCAIAAIGCRGWLTSPSFREKKAKTEEQRFDIWAEEIHKLLKAEKVERKNGETPIAFARRVDRTGMFSESVIPAGECLSLIRYSTADPTETDIVLLRDTARLIRDEISKCAKIRYIAQRLLSKKRNKRIIYIRKTKNEKKGG